MRKEIGKIMDEFVDCIPGHIETFPDICTNGVTRRDREFFFIAKGMAAEIIRLRREVEKLRKSQVHVTESLLSLIEE